MELDYIENVSNFDEHVVRLYNFSQAEAVLFRDLILEVVINRKQKLNLEKVSFIEPRNCNLILGLFSEDEGILTTDDETFFCMLTLETYQNMIKLLEPFCEKEQTGFKYLYDLDTQINFLVAPAGIW